MQKGKQTYILNYRVLVEKETYDDGTPVYVTQVPTLGISDYGPTLEKALENTQNLIKFHIESLIEERENVPAPDDLTNLIVTSSQIEIRPERAIAFT